VDRESHWSNGDVLAGKYRLDERLGAGGMGEVWSAEHLSIGTQVAIKLLSADVSLRPETRGRFEREARAAAALQSPHVVRVFDHGTESGVPFIVMERLVGETLAARLVRGPLPPADVARVVGQIALALSCAHAAGIVHRDLKPENVFLVAGDGGEVAKLLDFGIAKVSAEIAQKAAPTRTRSGSLLGTPLYMSPEQLRERPVDFRSDLWSLALVAFECSTGTTTFSGESVAEVIADVLSGHLPVPSERAQVPEGFDAWFQRAASRDPAARFEDARTMAAELARVARHDVTPPKPTTAAARATTATVTGDGSVLVSERRPARSAARVWLGAALILGAVGVSGALLARDGTSAAKDRASPSAEAAVDRAPADAPPETGHGEVRPDAIERPSLSPAATSVAPPPAIPSLPAPRSPAEPARPRVAAKPTASTSAPASAPSPSASTHVLGF
jgi:serine/threonine protein kinase